MADDLAMYEGLVLPDLIQRIRANVFECAGCWVWQGATSSSAGMPMMRLSFTLEAGGEKERRTEYVRRVVLQSLAAGPMPRRWVSAVLCETKGCVSPGCLLATTKAKQAKISAKRGAFKKPERFLKMSRTKRALSPYSDALIATVIASNAIGRMLAEETGISKSHINAIRRGATRRATGNPFAGLGARA